MKRISKKTELPKGTDKADIVREIIVNSVDTDIVRAMTPVNADKEDAIDHMAEGLQDLVAPCFNIDSTRQALGDAFETIIDAETAYRIDFDDDATQKQIGTIVFTGGRIESGNPSSLAAPVNLMLREVLQDTRTFGELDSKWQGFKKDMLLGKETNLTSFFESKYEELRQALAEKAQETSQSRVRG